MAFTMSGVEGGYDYNRFELFEGKGKKKCDKCKGQGCPHCKGRGYHDDEDDEKEEGAEGVSEALDPVGKEDGDVDNDGDKDSSDKYLLNRRKAIAKAMKKEEAELAEARKKGESVDDYVARVKGKDYLDKIKKKYSGGKPKTYDPMKDPNFDHDKAERTRGSMEEGYQRNPEKGDKEYEKKYGKVRGERTPMPPRGDKRREDFEKWYAKNVREDVDLSIFSDAELDFLEELLGKPEALDEGIGAIAAGAGKVLGGVAKAGAKAAGNAAKGAAKEAAKGAVRGVANRAQKAIDGEQEDVEEGYKPVPFEKMERQSGKAYKKEQEAVRKGDEAEANKQMKRRVAMKSPLGRRQELLKKNARSKPMGEAYEEMYAEVYKGKHGMSDKEYQDARSDAGKRISGDSKEGPASYATRIHRNSPPTAPGEKPKNVPGLSKAEREELKMRKANLKKEDVDQLNDLLEMFTDEELIALEEAAKKSHSPEVKERAKNIKKIRVTRSKIASDLGSMARDGKTSPKSLERMSKAAEKAGVRKDHMSKLDRMALKLEDLSNDELFELMEDKMDDFLAAMKKKHGLMDKSETDAIKKKKKEEKPTEAQLKQRKEGMKKLGDRRYFDSPRD